MVRHSKLPHARVVVDGHYAPPSPSVKRRLEGIVDRIRPIGRAVVTHVVGLLPLVLAMALALGLAWGAALGNSP